MTASVVPGRGGPVLPASGTYAGFISRALAFAVDAGVIMATSVIFGIAITAMFNVLEFSTDSQVAKALFALGTVGGVSFLYNVAGWSLFGKTLGKGIMGLRVVRRDGTLCRPLRAALRWVAYGLSTIGLLGFFWISVDNRRRAWHDHIAGTFVVYDGTSRSPDRLVEPLVPHR